MPRRKVLLHFGAHKTGSSYLQRVFADNEKLFADHGAVFLNPKPILERSTGAVRKYQLGDWQNTPLPEQFTGYIKKVNALDKDLFLSSEGYLGRLELHKTGTLYPTNRKMIDFFKKAFADRDVKVAFCLRDYSSFITSCYVQCAKTRKTYLSFDKYLSKIDLQNFSWTPIVEKLVETFGKENVFLWTQGQYRKGSQGINKHLLEFFFEEEISENDMQYNQYERINASLGKEQLRQIMKFNRELKKIRDLPKQQKNSLRRKKISHLRKTIIDDEPLKMDSNTSKKLHKQFRKDLKKIKKIYGQKIVT